MVYPPAGVNAVPRRSQSRRHFLPVAGAATPPPPLFLSASPPPHRRLVTYMTLLRLALVVAALAATSERGVHAHPLEDATHLPHARHLKQTAHRSQRACAQSAAVRRLQEHTAERRHAKWEQLRQERLRAAAPVLEKSHRANLTDVAPSEVDVKQLFGATPQCVLEPDVTEGPYYVKGELVRNDVREDQAGIDLYAELQVIDVNTCEPVSGLYIDFWHCNATGVYSGVVGFGNGDERDGSNINTTFARGLAPTDAQGVVQFVTKFPGHYMGRTTHIHVIGNHNGTLLANNTYVGSTVSNVGQVFFDMDLVKKIEATEVYNKNSIPLTTNAEDGIFLEEASTGYDPIMQYMLLGDKVEDGVFAWISIGIDMQHTTEVFAASSLTAQGGVANTNGFPFPPPPTVGDEPPFVMLNTAAGNTTKTPTSAAPVKIEEPSSHPVLALLLVAAVLLASTGVTNSDGAAAVAISGVLAAVYTLMLDVDFKGGIALAIITTTGGSIATFVENVRSSAGVMTSGKNLIDWDLLLVIQPSLLLGVLIGVFARGVLPEWLLSTVTATALLVCGSLLLQASHRRTDEHVGWSINEGSSLLDKPHKPQALPPLNVAFHSIPMEKLGVLAGVVFGVWILQVALVMAVPVVLLLYLAYKSHERTVDTYERQQLPRVVAGQGEMKWTLHVVRSLPVFSALGGTITGLLAIGSDIIVGPFVVQAGLDEAVAISTGATIALFSGSLASLECMARENLNGPLVLAVLVLSVAIKLFGEDVMARVLPEYMRSTSFLTFTLSVMTLIAGIALAITTA